MEERFPKKRNIRPEESSNLPLITLAILALIVFGLLYVGYEYVTDNGGGKAETAKEQVANAENEPKAAKKPAAAMPLSTVATPSLGGQSVDYTVKKGDSFYSIGNKFNLKTATVQSLNPSVDPNAGLKPGMKIKVQVMTTHTVGAGDILRVVAEKYKVTKKQLMAANEKTRDLAQRGETLLIPFSETK